MCMHYNSELVSGTTHVFKHLPSLQVYQEAPGVEHIPVVQIDLSVPLKVPGEMLCLKTCSRSRIKNLSCHYARHNDMLLSSSWSK